MRFAAFILSLFVVNLTPGLAGASKAHSVLVRDVNIVPMDAERVIVGQAVLVEDGIIVAIGPEERLSVPDGAQIIEGRGGYLIPGLSDMHAHIAGYAGEEGLGSNAPVARNQLLLYAASGVTMLRDPAGTDSHFNYVRKLEQGEWLGPRLFFTGPPLEGEKNVWPFSPRITDPADVEPLYAGYAAKGYWGVKLYHTISREVYDAAIEAADRHGLFVVGHVPFEVGIEGALEARQYSIEHLRGYDFDGIAADELFVDGGRSAKRFSVFARMSDARMKELVDKTIAAGVWNDPTLVIAKFLFDAEGRNSAAERPKMALVHPDLRKQLIESESLDAIFSADSRRAMEQSFPKQLEFVRQLNDAGAKLLIGTDTIVPAYVEGFGVLDEMKLFAQAGLSPYAVLRAATRNAAESLGVSDRFGRIAVGMHGDMVLLSGNPLESLTPLERPEGVLLRGEWKTIAEIEADLAELSKEWGDVPGEGN